MADENNAIEQFVIDKVNNDPGIKGVALVTQLVVDQGKNLIPPDIDILELIDRLVKEGKLLEVEYILPSMSHRIKSLYFPKETRITPVVP